MALYTGPGGGHIPDFRLSALPSVEDDPQALQRDSHLWPSLGWNAACPLFSCLLGLPSVSLPQWHRCWRNHWFHGRGQRSVRRGQSHPLVPSSSPLLSVGIWTGLSCRIIHWSILRHPSDPKPYSTSPWPYPGFIQACPFHTHCPCEHT